MLGFTFNSIINTSHTVYSEYQRTYSSDMSLQNGIEELDHIFEELRPAGPSDMGKVMGRVMGKFKGQNIDGALVKQLVQKRLQG